MVYRERTKDGITRLTGSASGGGEPGPPGEDGTDGTDGLTPQLRGTSTSSVAIGTGSKTFILPTPMNVAFPLGAIVRAYGSNVNNYMTGVVTAATTSSVTINVTETGGVGTFNSWTLVLSGFRGANGQVGTRWGTTNAWMFVDTANLEVFFEDGLAPRTGDLVVSNNGLGPGSVYVVTAPVSATHADLGMTGVNLRGPEGPAGDDALASWPIGSIFIAYGPNNPATMLGGGEWVPFAEGRVLVGFDASDPMHDADGEAGGAKTHALTVNELPPHKHEVIRASNTGGHATRVAQGGSSSAANPETGNSVGMNGDAFNIMQPYITVHMWRRTA